MKIGSLFSRCLQHPLSLFFVCLIFISANNLSQSDLEPKITSPWLVQPPTDYEKAVEVVREQLAALRANDASKAYYAYTTKEFRKSFTLENFKLMVRRFSVFGRNKAFTVETTDFDGATLIKLKGKLIAVNGDTMKVDYDVVLEDNEWKVHNIQLTQQAPVRAGPGPS